MLEVTALPTEPQPQPSQIFIGFCFPYFTGLYYYNYLGSTCGKPEYPEDNHCCQLVLSQQLDSAAFDAKI